MFEEVDDLLLGVVSNNPRLETTFDLRRYIYFLRVCILVSVTAVWVYFPHFSQETKALCNSGEIVSLLR